MGNCVKGKDKEGKKTAEELAQDEATDQQGDPKPGNTMQPKTIFRLPKDSLTVYRKQMGKSANNKNDAKTRNSTKKKQVVIDLRSKQRNQKPKSIAGHARGSGEDDEDDDDEDDEETESRKWNTLQTE